MGRVVLILWLYPFLEFSWLVIGLGRAVRNKKRDLGDSGATEAIVQITTIGNYDSVNEIIQAVRDYQLSFPYKFWVVVEPGVENHYTGADLVIEVPAEFDCLASYKARAQEYSRRVRQERGLNRFDVKIFMLDDDSLPTKSYFESLYQADYDICEGVLTPRRGYGRFLTHLDDLRTYSCLVICSFWQGLGHPLWVHGEGLCLRGSAEEQVTWNYPVVASEDFTVGQNAVELGLKWGFVWEYVQLTSPFTFKDFLKQRRRWLWGNIHAMRHGLVPPLGGSIVAVRWVLGLIIEILVTLAFILVPTGEWRPPRVLLAILITSAVLWFASFVGCCWIGANEDGVPLWKKILNTAIGTLLAPASAAITAYVIIRNFIKGDPKAFEVIDKVNPAATGSAKK
jgi:hypothetical protein